MTNEDMLDDLKQFIDARFAQQNEELDGVIDQKLDQKFDEKLAPIKQQLSDLTDFVTDAIDTSNDTTGKQLAEHEQRISQLERKTA